MLIFIRVRWALPTINQPLIMGAVPALQTEPRERLILFGQGGLYNSCGNYQANYSSHLNRHWSAYGWDDLIKRF